MWVRSCVRAEARAKEDCAKNPTQGNARRSFSQETSLTTVPWADFILPTPSILTLGVEVVIRGVGNEVRLQYVGAQPNEITSAVKF